MDAVIPWAREISARAWVSRFLKGTGEIGSLYESESFRRTSLQVRVARSPREGLNDYHRRDQVNFERPAEIISGSFQQRSRYSDTGIVD